MKIKYVFLFLLLVPVLLMAQDVNPADTLPEPAFKDSVAPFAPFDKPGLTPYNPDKKLSVRMEMGSGFGVGSGSAGLFSVYAAPHISYKVSPRFRVNFGIIIQNSNFINYYNPYNPYYPEYTQTFGSNITRSLVYVEGEYLLTPKLLVNARMYKEISTFGEPQVNPRALDLDGEGVSVGFQYKINEHMQVGAQFEYNKGSNPYNPFYRNSPMHRPFSSPYGIERNSVFDTNPEW